MMQLERIYSMFVQAQGPVYGDLRIIHGGLEFYVVEANTGEEYSEYGLPIRINDHNFSALPIAQFGFRLEDFKDVPLNKFGLKEVASSRNEKLVVTANSLFVLYAHGVPSLLGLPSEKSELSGIWVDEEDTLKFPKHSIYPMEEAIPQFLVSMQSSFRKIPIEAINLLRYVTRTSEEENIETTQSFCLCDHCLGHFHDFEYQGLYAGLKDIRVDWEGGSHLNSGMLERCSS